MFIQKLTIPEKDKFYRNISLRPDTHILLFIINVKKYDMYLTIF